MGSFNMISRCLKAVNHLHVTIDLDLDAGIGDDKGDSVKASRKMLIASIF